MINLRTVLIAIAYLLSLSQLVLAVFFWKTHSNSTIRKVMAFLTLSTGLWIGSTAASTYQLRGSLVDLLATLVFVFSVFSLTLLLHFTFIWPTPVFRFNPLGTLALYLPAIGFSTLILFTHTIILENIFAPGYYGSSVPGSLFTIYNSYLLLLYCTAVLIMFYRYFRKYGLKSHTMKIVLWALLIGGLPTIILNILITLYYGVQVNPLLGVMPNVVWSGGIAYIILKK